MSWKCYRCEIILKILASLEEIGFMCLAVLFQLLIDALKLHFNRSNPANTQNNSITFKALIWQFSKYRILSFHEQQVTVPS